MSGGVDSSVAAALLVEQGYQVTGAYMKQWSDGADIQGVCSWKQDRRDALRVAAHLGIPLITLDFEKEYKEWVMGYMFREYEEGRTPNPDVMCNRFIKFGAWLDKAKDLGFDYLATGHYARIKISNFQFPISHRNAASLKSRSLVVSQLQCAKDLNKDQTYFLHQLNQDQLRHVMFPIGKYTKPQVRKMAVTFGLPTAEREESMGICFIGEVPMKDFLQQKIKKQLGKIITTEGKVIGEHEGLTFYTIGQRHGLAQAGGGKPLFVVEKNKEKNELIVGLETDPKLYKKEFAITDIHWISGDEPKLPFDCMVRLRHRQELQSAVIKKKRGTNTIVVVCRQKQRAITPGQFAVFYKGSLCAGGAVVV